MTKDDTMINLGKAEFKVNLAQLAVLVLNLCAVIWGAAILSNTVKVQGIQIATNYAQNQAEIKTLSEAQAELGKEVSEMKGTLIYQTKVLDNINQVVMSRKSVVK